MVARRLIVATLLPTSNSKPRGCTDQSWMRSLPGSPDREFGPSPLHPAKELKSVLRECRNVAQRLDCHPRLTCRPAQRPHTARRLLQRLAQACGTVQIGRASCRERVEVWVRG